MQHLRRAALLAVALPVLAGCAQPQRDGFGSLASSYRSYDYVDPSVGRGDGHRYLQETTAEGPATESAGDSLVRGVTGLLTSVPGSTGLNFWAGRCAPGTRVTDVEPGPRLVVVRLSGLPRGHQRCRLTAAEREVQRQQVAWTVVRNVDPLDEHEPPAVRVVAPDGEVWPDVVADPSFLHPDARPNAGR